MGDLSDQMGTFTGEEEEEEPEEEEEGLGEDYFGQWAAEYPDCVGRMNIDPGVQTFLLCFCIISACQALYFIYLNLPQYQSGGRVRASWEFVVIPVVEALVYGLNSTSAHVGYLRLFNGRAVVWLRTAHWALTIPLLLMQIGKMSTLKFHGHDINSIQIWVGILMVVFGFSASLAEVEGIKWMFFFFALLCLIFIFLSSYKIMATAGKYYISLNSTEGLHTAMRIRILMLCFFVSWSGYPLFWILGIEGACVLSESVVSVCMAVLDCFAKNIFGMVMWDTLWNSELNGRWTSNAEAMALEMDPLPDKDVMSSSDSPHDVPYAEDGDGLKHVAADVVVRPGSVAGVRKGSRIGATGSRPGSAVPMEAPPYPVIIYAATQKDAELAQSQMYLRGSNGNPVLFSGTPPKPANYAIEYDGGFQFGQAGPASILRSRQQSFENTQAPGNMTVPGLAGRFSQAQPMFAATGGVDSGALGRTRESVRDNNMDDVVDHVRSLNQALSDLLTVDPGASGARSSHAV